MVFTTPSATTLMPTPPCLVMRSTSNSGYRQAFTVKVFRVNRQTWIIDQMSTVKDPIIVLKSITITNHESEIGPGLSFRVRASRLDVSDFITLIASALGVVRKEAFTFTLTLSVESIFGSTAFTRTLGSSRGYRSPSTARTAPALQPRLGGRTMYI